MALLPQHVGSLTLMRAIGSDGVTETHVGILDEPSGKVVAVRRVSSGISRDEHRMAAVKARVEDLFAVQPGGNLLQVHDLFEDDDAWFMVEEWVDAVSLAEIITWCRANQTTVPHNVFLDLAAQICNGLETLHSLTGSSTGAARVLHLGVRPESIFVTRDGEVRLGNYGLERSPTLAPHSGGIRLKKAYISPEQTSQGQALDAASDLFSLGAVLYELLLLKPMFTGSTPLRTIAKVRKAVITTELLEVKEILAGLDRVLYRALAVNQRHRYPHAFVLRGDLKGLMAGFSFNDIRSVSRSFLTPLFAGKSHTLAEVHPSVPVDHSEGSEAVVAVLDRFDDLDFRSIRGQEEIDTPRTSIEPMELGLAMAEMGTVTGNTELLLEAPTLPPRNQQKSRRKSIDDTLDPTPRVMQSAGPPVVPLLIASISLFALTGIASLYAFW